MAGLAFWCLLLPGRGWVCWRVSCNCLKFWSERRVEWVLLSQRKLLIEETFHKFAFKPEHIKFVGSGPYYFGPSCLSPASNFQREYKKILCIDNELFGLENSNIAHLIITTLHWHSELESHSLVGCGNWDAGCQGLCRSSCSWWMIQGALGLRLQLMKLEIFPIRFLPACLQAFLIPT